MRRVVWPVLTGLGVFFIVLALLSRFFVPGQAIKFPLNEYRTTTLQADNASYFSPKFVTEESGVTLQATTTTRGDVAAAKSIDSSRVAVWQTYTAIEDTSNHTPVDIPAAGNSLAFDRKTGALVSWSGNSVEGTHVSVTPNEQGSVFPLGTKKQNYQVFDTTLKKPVTFRYKDITATDGVATYVFVATVPSQQIGTQTVPGSLVGLTASAVTLQDSTGTTRLVLLSANFQTTPDSVTSAVSTDNGDATKISLINVTIPIVAGLCGQKAEAAGGVLGECAGGTRLAGGGQGRRRAGRRGRALRRTRRGDPRVAGGQAGEDEVAQVDRLRRRTSARPEREADQAPPPRPVLGRPVNRHLGRESLARAAVPDPPVGGPSSARHRRAGRPMASTYCVFCDRKSRESGAKRPEPRSRTQTPPD